MASLPSCSESSLDESREVHPAGSAGWSGRSRVDQYSRNCRKPCGDRLNRGPTFVYSPMPFNKFVKSQVAREQAAWPTLPLEMSMVSRGLQLNPAAENYVSARMTRESRAWGTHPPPHFFFRVLLDLPKTPKPLCSGENQQKERNNESY